LQRRLPHTARDPVLPYNARFSSEAIMEAERINQIASTLAGLNTRSEELRRYL
jgi:hypothetical protein